MKPQFIVCNVSFRPKTWRFTDRSCVRNHWNAKETKCIYFIYIYTYSIYTYSYSWVSFFFLDHFLPFTSGLHLIIYTIPMSLFHPGNRVFKGASLFNSKDVIFCPLVSLLCKFIYLPLKNKLLLFRQFPTIDKTLYFCIVLFIDFFLNKIILLWRLYQMSNIVFLIAPLCKWPRFIVP